MDAMYVTNQMYPPSKHRDTNYSKDERTQSIQYSFDGTVHVIATLMKNAKAV